MISLITTVEWSKSWNNQQHIKILWTNPQTLFRSHQWSPWCQQRESQVTCFFVFHDTDVLWKSMGRSFCQMSSSLSYILIRFWFCIFGRNITEFMLHFSLCIVSGDGLSYRSKVNLGLLLGCVCQVAPLWSQQDPFFNMTEFKKTRIMVKYTQHKIYHLTMFKRLVLQHWGLSRCCSTITTIRGNFSSSWTETLCWLNTNSSFSPSPGPWHPPFYSLSLGFAYLGISSVESYSVCLYLTVYFTQHHVLKVHHVVTGVRISFRLNAGQISPCCIHHTLFMNLSHDRHELLQPFGYCE